MKGRGSAVAALVGIDCGASGVRVLEVRPAALPPESRGGREALPAGEACLEAGAARRELAWPLVEGFEPASDPEAPLSAAEEALGEAWVEGIASSAAGVLAAARGAGAGGGRALAGICAPGVKTADRRGIAYSLRGPRIPDLAERLERRLAELGAPLAAPIAPIESDGDCSGLGERAAPGGLFRGVANAWYVGGGSGVAEALQIEGEPVPMERAEPWFPRAWRIPFEHGASFDRALSVAGALERWRRERGAGAGFPEERAGLDPLAAEILAGLGRALGRLVLLRMLALERRSAEHGGPLALERAVVGQRLGALCADPRARPHLALAAERELRAGLAAHGARELSWPGGSRERSRAAGPAPDRPGPAAGGLAGEGAARGSPALEVVASTLRDAPAIGAAAAALSRWRAAGG